MNKKATTNNYMGRSSIRNFSVVEETQATESYLETRTTRAQLAVKRAQQIVMKNNAMVEDLRLRNLTMNSSIESNIN